MDKRSDGGGDEKKTVLEIGRYGDLLGDHLSVLTCSLPLQLVELALDFRGCSRVRVEGVSQALEHLVELKTLTLELSGCERLACIGELGPGLGQLQALTLRLNYCQGLTSLHDFGRGLVYHPALQTLSLELHHCSALRSLDGIGAGIGALASAGGALKALTLDCRGCVSLVDCEDFFRGAMQLPELQSLSVSFRDCVHLRALGELGLTISCLASHLADLSIVLAGCSALTYTGDLQGGLLTLRRLRHWQGRFYLDLTALRCVSQQLAREFHSVDEFCEVHRSALAAEVAAATAIEIVEGAASRTPAADLMSTTLGGSSQETDAETASMNDTWLQELESEGHGHERQASADSPTLSPIRHGCASSSACGPECEDAEAAMRELEANLLMRELVSIPASAEGLDPG
eukprot:TRINITY_DN39530_c0_g1_i1.p1 TRINITY_DN39530_c0_g1~~TRINITY_DN39530_c0_g1_i1.p1  ORF type:complete len:403 (+),score=102.09 TRINITY_DN39530_c0_g1_i1:180-1388(+)